MFYVSMIIAIAGLVTYQLTLKAAPKTVNPFWLLTAAYLLAALACVPTALFWRRWYAPEDTGLAPAHLGAAALIALAVLLIETGYLLIYRTGWSLSVAPGVGQAITLSLLFLIGVAVLGERFTLIKAAGMACTLVGIFLLTRKG